MVEFSALIPLRIGSKGIKKKNIKPIAGKPLCEWTIKAASQSNFIEKIYVSTESEEIARSVKSIGVNVNIIERPRHLASDTASTESVMLHAIENMDTKHLVTIQATSPLLTAEDLDNACFKLLKHGYDSLLSAVKSRHFIWTNDAKPLNYNPSFRPRRQEFEGSYAENGAFYISDCKKLKETKVRLHGKIGIYEMPEKTLAELDTIEDWELIEPMLLDQSLSANGSTEIAGERYSLDELKQATTSYNNTN